VHHFFRLSVGDFYLLFYEAMVKYVYIWLLNTFSIKQESDIPGLVPKKIAHIHLYYERFSVVYTRSLKLKRVTDKISLDRLKKDFIPSTRRCGFIDESNRNGRA
jgi:hypothetical protein